MFYDLGRQNFYSSLISGYEAVDFTNNIDFCRRGSLWSGSKAIALSLIASHTCILSPA